jgi:hypothetical protein
MKWKNAMAAAVLTIAIVFPVLSCGTAITTSASAPVTTPVTTAVGIQTPIPNSLSDNRTMGPPFSGNGTMPFPPSDNSTRPAGPGGDSGARPSMPAIDWSAAAAKLGVSVEKLKAAVGDLAPGKLDFAAIATELGVTEDVVKEVLGFLGAVPPQGVPPLTTPPGDSSALNN